MPPVKQHSSPLGALRANGLFVARGGSASWAALAVGILAISAASILIRLAEAPALAVGAWRMLLATILLTPWALPRVRREWAALERPDLALLCLSGLALAIHFATWITSLSLTSVASSVILVTTNPIYVGLASHYLLGEAVTRRKVLAIFLVLVGSVIVGFGDLRVSGRALLGDALALAGALAMSAHILLGRVLRRKLSTLAYVWPCYGLAGLLLACLCGMAGQPLVGYPGQTYLMFVLLALVPQVLGHSTFNWALAHVSPLLVSLAILGEPLAASVLALLILGEVPAPATMLGGPLIVAGIYLACRDELAVAPLDPTHQQGGTP